MDSRENTKRNMEFFDAAPDGYVRLTLAQLHSAELHHLESELDPTIAVPEEAVQPSADLVTGFTEWTGTHGKLKLSIGWDWGLVRDVLVLVNPAEIRTNIKLISDQGYDESPLFTRLQLVQRIERLPWREEPAIRKLLEQARKG
jgi:hypothetical protein